MSISYSTHIKMLTKYLLPCPNDSIIVETGCGAYSSIIMSEFAKYKNLKHLIYYSDKSWKEQIEPLLYSDYTSFIYVEDWTRWTPDKNAYLYLHDSEENTKNRFKRIDSILPLCKYLVLHDSDMYRKLNCNINKYDIADEDTLRSPWTAVIKGYRDA